MNGPQVMDRYKISNHQKLSKKLVFGDFDFLLVVVAVVVEGFLEELLEPELWLV